MTTALNVSIDPANPDDFERLLELALMNENFVEARANLLLLNHYTTFRIQLEEFREGWPWGGASIMAEEALYGLAGVLPEVHAARIGSQLSTVGHRREAVRQLPIVTQIDEVLGWLDDAHPVSFGLVPQHEDLLMLCTILCVDIPVLQNIPGAFYQDRIERHIPLVLAWWHAMNQCGILHQPLLERTVYPGSQADAFVDAESVELAAAETLVTKFVAAYLVEESIHGDAEIPELIFTIKRLLYSMTIDEARPGAAPAFLTSDPHDDESVAIAQQLSDEHLDRLTSLQMLTVIDGSPVVPAPLWPSMIEGLSLGLHQLQEFETENRDYEWF